MSLNVHGIQTPKEKLNQIWIIPFTNVAQSKEMLRPFYQPLAVLQTAKGCKQTISFVIIVENAGCIYRWIRRDGFVVHLTHLTVDSKSANPPACIGASSSHRSDKVGRLFAHPHL